MHTLPPQQEHARIVDGGCAHTGTVHLFISPVRPAEGALPETPSSDNSKRKWDWEQQPVELAKQDSEEQYMVAGVQLLYDHPAQTPEQQTNCQQAVRSQSQAAADAAVSYGFFVCLCPRLNISLVTSYLCTPLGLFTTYLQI